MKQKRTGYVENYHPMEWVQTSGQDVTRDAEYVVCLSKLEQRQHEIWRLGVIHGRWWAHQVQAKVADLWDSRHQVRAKYPRATMEQIEQIINQNLRKAA